MKRQSSSKPKSGLNNDIAIAKMLSLAYFEFPWS